ncbi:MAG: MIP/aquaporin family protein [Pseudomonadota bacterium]
MAAAVARRLTAEGVGTALLLAIVVGSGHMGETLAAGNDAIALLGNTIATAAGLIVLILMFGPISGAHFNPAVTLAAFLQGGTSKSVAASFVGVQIIGGVAGVLLAHAMFDLEVLQASAKARSGFGQAIGEFVATFGLVSTILFCVRQHPRATPYAVGLFIAAGYWFTSSTSFANPAVTIARTLTDTFAGIRPADAPVFILAQTAGAVAGVAFSRFVLGASFENPVEHQCCNHPELCLAG